jgi:hypothetical protein
MQQSFNKKLFGAFAVNGVTQFHREGAKIAQAEFFPGKQGTWAW